MMCGEGRTQWRAGGEECVVIARDSCIATDFRYTIKLRTVHRHVLEKTGSHYIGGEATAGRAGEGAATIAAAA